MKPRERHLKIEQMPLMGLGENAQGVGDEEMPPLGLGAPFPLVDQQAVGNERECERDGRPFARIQELEGRFGGWSGRISHQSGGCAIQVRTAFGAPVSINSVATVWGTSTRLYRGWSTCTAPIKTR